MNYPHLLYRPNRPLAGYAGFGRLGFSMAQGSTVGTAAQYAKYGSVAGPWGTAIGAAIGALASVFGRKDQEAANFDEAITLYHANPDSVYGIADKYLALTGLFDLKNIHTNIPIYKKYGRMGEQKFVTDMIRKVYDAAQNGQITVNDTPLTIFSRIIQPWIDSFGYGSMQDPNADMINRLMIGMIMDYLAGNQASWRARGGDYPFGSLPPFSMPQAALAPQAQALPAAPAPVPYVASNIPTPMLAPPLPGAYQGQGPMLQPLPARLMPLPVAAAPAPAAPDQTALIQQLLAQGASQQQAFQAALSQLQSQGQPITPQVQQQVASEVQTHATTAGFSGGGWIAGGLAIVAILFATARPAKRK
jgi:hypothetical protein